ncbi:glycoside hydrolase family 88 protein [uncultured Sunxiuqinia sp.]|uniref:glycoside hydrolase family 88/105 protein n=1 Tax=uncultured Sunxiuqinia sp. TaxID=1573825 RepID=UPI00262FD96B|nr:glycoside hydrolase family 88 protein [uncultured Sunxiuqinia sp.]
MKKVLSVLLLFMLVGSLNAGNKDKLFKPNHIKKVMKKATFWQLKNPKHKLYDWTNGAFYAGVFAAYETTGSQKIWKALMEMGEANEWKPGPRLQHADDHAICQTYIDIYRIEKDEKMIAPFRETADKIMATPYKTGEIRPITWWWCDALFMAPPALVKLGVTLGDDKYLEFNDRLFKETYDLLFDQEEDLYARDIQYKTDWKEPRYEANGEKIFWSRGNGWVMGGLVRVLEELPADYKNRQFYEDQFLRMASKIKALQQADGLWRASLLDPQSYPGGESSGSGFYTYALAWGINNGLLDKEEYQPVVEKAWIGLNGLLQADGHVGWTQPIGADPRANFSNDSWEVYGTGAFLLAGSEVIKMDW